MIYNTVRKAGVGQVDPKLIIERLADIDTVAKGHKTKAHDIDNLRIGELDTDNLESQAPYQSTSESWNPIQLTSK